MSILRLLLAVVLIVVVGAFVMGYLSNRNYQRVVSLPDRTETADTVARARDGAAQIGEKAGEAATTVGATLDHRAARDVSQQRAISQRVAASSCYR